MSIPRLILIGGVSSLAAVLLSKNFISEPQKASAQSSQVIAARLIPFYPASPVSIAPAIPIPPISSTAESKIVTVRPVSKPSFQEEVPTRWKIGYCNGQPSEGANFRSTPTLNSDSILGVIPVGAEVEPTGRYVVNDGTEWIQVKNSDPLFPSANPGSINQDLRAEQIGLVAICNLRRKQNLL